MRIILKTRTLVAAARAGVLREAPGAAHKAEIRMVRVKMEVCGLFRKGAPKGRRSKLM